MYIESDTPINVGGGNNAGSGFGFGNDAWVLIILFALIFGWGNNGFNGNGNNGGAMDNYVLASDFATLQRQIDSGVSSLERKGDAINSGLCDGFYAMNTGMLNGFAGVNSAITTSGYETRNAIQGLSSQLAQCCCDIRTGLGDIKYANAINARDIIESNNANYRALHDEIVANRIEDKNAQIVAQQNEINALRLKASQEAQNNYLVNTLRPVAQPAYLTCSPYQSIFGCGTCNNICGNSCGSVV